MRHLSVKNLLALLPLAFVLTAQAEPTDYASPFSVAPNMIITATSTGTIEGYFVSSFAGGDDSIRLFNVTANTYSPWLLDNKTSVSGDSASFGHVTKGDVLVLELKDAGLSNPDDFFAQHDGLPLGPILASDPAYSADGITHTFAQAYQGGLIDGVLFPAGTYVGMEDLPRAVSDLDYNDTTFIFTGITATLAPVPEPSTFGLLGTGVLGAAGLLRRRISSSCAV